MKSVITALLILVIIVGGSILCTDRLDNFSHKLVLKNNTLHTLISENNFDDALTLLDELEADIKKKSLLLASVLDHTQIDKIKLSIAEAKAYVTEHNKADSLSFINALDSMFSHIHKNYQVRIENIL